jgi:hypothetical protein
MSSLSASSGKAAEIEAAWAQHLSANRYIAFVRKNWLTRHLKTQKGRCKYCKIRIRINSDSIENLATVDHVAPRSRGGADEFGNTVAACSDCNKAKGSRDLDEFLCSDWLRQKIADVAQPPDRLCTEEKSPFYDGYILSFGVGIRFNGKDRADVVEYCISEGWIRACIPGSKDRRGNPLAVKIAGIVEPYLRKRP